MTGSCARGPICSGPTPTRPFVACCRRRCEAREDGAYAQRASNLHVHGYQSTCIASILHPRPRARACNPYVQPHAVDELYTTPCASACIRELLMISCALVVPDPIDASTRVHCDSKAPYTHMHAQIHAHSCIASILHPRPRARACNPYVQPHAVDELYTTPCASACIRELLMISCALVVPDPIDASTRVHCDSKAPYTHMHAQIHAHSWIDHHFILPRRAAPTVMQATAGTRASTCAACMCARAPRAHHHARVGGYSGRPSLFCSLTHLLCYCCVTCVHIGACLADEYRRCKGTLPHRNVEAWLASAFKVRRSSRAHHTARSLAVYSPCDAHVVLIPRGASPCTRRAMHV